MTKNTLLKTLSILIVATVLFALIPKGIIAFADSIVDSGSCGEDVCWELYSDDSLVIYGKGAMFDYAYAHYDEGTPWGARPKSVKIHDGVTEINGCAFYDCADLTSVTIPNTVTRIGCSAFSDCTGLKSITIPSSVTIIEWSAFSGCTGLTSIKIPNSVKSIDSSAFQGCTALTNVSIPGSVMSVGEDAFEDTGYYNNRSNWDNNVLYLNNWLLDAREDLSGTYEIKKGTVGVADGVFSGCAGLTGITIPDSVKIVGRDAFKDTGYYNSINNWESGLLYIGKWLVDNEYEISGDVVIKDGTVGIAGGVLDDDSACPSLNITSLRMPNSVKYIGDSFLSSCRTMTRFGIPNGVKYIGDYAFCDCGFTSITIPASVTHIGHGAFFRIEYISGYLYRPLQCTLKVRDGSAGHKYATNNGFKFELVGGEADAVDGSSDPDEGSAESSEGSSGESSGSGESVNDVIVTSGKKVIWNGSGSKVELISATLTEEQAASFNNPLTSETAAGEYYINEVLKIAIPAADVEAGLKNEPSVWETFEDEPISSSSEEGDRETSGGSMNWLLVGLVAGGTLTVAVGVVTIIARMKKNKTTPVEEEKISADEENEKDTGNEDTADN